MKFFKKHYKFIICIFFVVGIVAFIATHLKQVRAVGDEVTVYPNPVFSINRNSYELYSLGEASATSRDGKYFFVLSRLSYENRSVLSIYKKGSYDRYTFYQRITGFQNYDGQITGMTYYESGSSTYILVASSTGTPSIRRYQIDINNGSIVGSKSYDLGYTVSGIAWDYKNNEFIVTKGKRNIYAFDINFTTGREIRISGSKGSPRGNGIVGYNYTTSDIEYYNGKIYSIMHPKSTSVCEDYSDGFSMNESCSSAVSKGDSYVAVFDLNTGDYSKLIHINGSMIGSYSSQVFGNSDARELRGINFAGGYVYFNFQGNGNTVVFYAKSTDSIFTYKNLYVTYNMNGGSLASAGSNYAASSNGDILYQGSPRILAGKTGELLVSGGFYDYNDPSRFNIRREGYHVVPSSAWRDSSGVVYSQTKQYKVSDIADISLSDKTITLYVNWVANNYTVNFKSNDGAGGVASQVMTYDRTITLNPNPFVRTGYTFKNWNTQPNGSGANYANRAPVMNLTSAENGVFYLYAQWQPITYKLTLKDNDGTSNYIESTLQYDTEYHLSGHIPTRDGYNFLGWSRSNDSNVPTYSPTEVVSKLSTTQGAIVTLYGVWQAHEHTINFVSNGGSAVQSIVKNYGDQLGELPIPTRRGYLFDGWYTENGVRVDASTVVKGDATYYARWVTIVYNLKLINNDGSDTSQTITMAYDTTYNLSDYIPSREGYTFLGWSESSNSTTATYSPTEVLQNLTEVQGKTIELYGVWEINKYTIDFSSNGGSTVQSITKNYGEEIGELPIPTKTGYLFAKWTTIGGETINPSMVVKSNISCFANWVAIVYRVSYSPNGGSGSMNPQDMTYDVYYNLSQNTFTRSNHIFTGWNTKADGSGNSYSDKQQVINLAISYDETVTLFAQWEEAETYTITYDLGGGNVSSANPSTYNVLSNNITLNNPSKEGYTFIGWTGSNGNTPSTQVTIPTGTTGNLNYKANYEINKYTINFVNGDSTESMELDFNSEIGNVPTASKKGYTFLGWYDENDNPLADRVPAHNTTYTARFRANKYSITFDSNSGTGSMSKQILTYDTRTSLLSNAFVKSGYKFKEWNTKEDGSGKSYSDREEVLNLMDEDDAGMVLYAIWTVSENPSTAGETETTGEQGNKEEQTTKKTNVKNPKTGAVLNIVLVLFLIVIGVKTYKFAITKKKFRKI